MKRSAAFMFWAVAVLVMILPWRMPLVGQAISRDALSFRGVRICGTAPSSSQVMAFNGTQWCPSSSSGLGTVTSVVIAGTTNQITASGTCTITTTGTCTLSLPSGLVLPGTINGITLTTSTGTITLTNGKTFTVLKTLTLDGTDGVTITFPASSATVATLGLTNTFTGRQDASGAASTAPSKVGTSPPGTCAVGDQFFDSDATAGSNLYGCTAPNTWTLQAGGSGGTFATQMQCEDATSAVVVTSPECLAQFLSVNSPVPDPTGQTGKVLTSNGTTGTWQTASGGSTNPVSSGTVFYLTTFTGCGAGGTATTIPGTNWSLLGDGSFTTVAATTTKRGYCEFSTGAVDTQRARIVASSQTPIHTKQPGLTTSYGGELAATTNNKFSFGVGADEQGVRTTADCSDECAVYRYIAGTDTNFQCVTRGSMGATVRDSGVAANTSYHYFSLTWNGTSYDWTIDGSTVCTGSPTTNLPSKAGNPVLIIDTQGANNSKMNVAFHYIAWSR